MPELHCCFDTVVPSVFCSSAGRLLLRHALFDSDVTRDGAIENFVHLVLFARSRNTRILVTEI